MGGVETALLAPWGSGVVGCRIAVGDGVKVGVGVAVPYRISAINMTVATWRVLVAVDAATEAWGLAVGSDIEVQATKINVKMTRLRGNTFIQDSPKLDSSR